MYRTRMVWLWFLALGFAINYPVLAAETDVAPSGGCTASNNDDISCGCSDCRQECCQPLWTFRADAMFLNRSGMRDQPFLINGSLNNIVDANQLDLPMQIGWELDLARRLKGPWAVEARYFNLGGQSVTVPGVQSGSGAGVQYFNDALGIFEVNTTSDLKYSSQLQNVEVNLHKDVTDNLTLLAGFRYMNLDDGGILIVQRDIPGTYGVDARQQVEAFNELFGVQIGADAVLLRRNRFTISGDIKAGIFDDKARNRFSYDSNYFQIHALTGASAYNTAFAGEVGVKGAYEVNKHISIFGGYRLLWIDGVALAAQQSPANLAPISGPADTVVTTGDAFYNGAFAGLEFCR
jgi:hypothetical protein